MVYEDETGGELVLSAEELSLRYPRRQIGPMKMKVKRGTAEIIRFVCCVSGEYYVGPGTKFRIEKVGVQAQR